MEPRVFVTDQELFALSRRMGVPALPFTGERVIPGAVETQLWNEHISRYRFASLFADQKRVLDVGCGAGYGTEVIGRGAAAACGCDISADAIAYARQRFTSGEYLVASATALPFAPGSFDLITAFEVIEHLEDWPSLLRDGARLLSREGVFLVSTPNRDYYQEARGGSGPNPYHVHEFDWAEYVEALQNFFPFVEVFAQNQQETISFSGGTSQTRAEAYIASADSVADAHFFVAVCGLQPRSLPAFADVASTRNLLREREKHLWGVMGELASERQEHQALVQTTERELSRLRAELTEAHSALESLRGENQAIRNSSWVRLGKAIGLGPGAAGKKSARSTSPR